VSTNMSNVVNHKFHAHVFKLNYFTVIYSVLNSDPWPLACKSGERQCVTPLCLLKFVPKFPYIYMFVLYQSWNQSMAGSGASALIVHHQLKQRSFNKCGDWIPTLCLQVRSSTNWATQYLCLPFCLRFISIHHRVKHTCMHTHTHPLH